MLYVLFTQLDIYNLIVSNNNDTNDTNNRVIMM